MAWRHVLLIIVTPLLFSTHARAEDKEPTAIIELGGLILARSALGLKKPSILRFFTHSLTHTHPLAEIP